MFWLTFLVMAVLLYTPPLNLGHYLLQQAEGASFGVRVVGWSLPGWLVYAVGSITVYLISGAFLCWLDQTILDDSRASRFVHHLSVASLRSIGWLVLLYAVLVIVFRFIGFPAINLIYRTSLHISAETIVLAVLALLAEVLRLAENNAWGDRAYAAGNIPWLVQHGYLRR